MIFVYYNLHIFYVFLQHTFIITRQPRVDHILNLYYYFILVYSNFTHINLT